MSSFSDAVAAGPIVLDGGLGTLLEAHGHDLSSSLWSARLLRDDPEAIRRAHAEFFAAGARVAITSSYQVSYSGMDAAGASHAEVDAILSRSVQLARDARDEAGLEPDAAWVAASVGPFGAARADGSEYTGVYGLTVSQLREWHRPRLHALAAAEPDAIAVETVPSLAEVEAVCIELEAFGIPAWISMTISHGALRSGDSLAEAFALAGAAPGVIAVGVNCCEATEVSDALAKAAVTGLPGVAYPNSGERWNAETRQWSGEAVGIASRAGDWVARGGRLIGGCCRVRPDEIAEVARSVSLLRSVDANPGRYTWPAS